MEEEYICPLCNGTGDHIWLSNDTCSCSKSKKKKRCFETCKESPSINLKCSECDGTGKITWLQRVFG